MAGDALCWFAFQRAALFRATVLAHEKRPISASLRHPASARFAIRPTASGDMLDIYIYVFGSQSCATRLVFVGSAPLIDIAFGDSASLRGIPASAQNKAAHGTSGRVRRVASHLGLAPAPRAVSPGVFTALRAAMLRRRNTAFPAPSLPASSRRYAPQCFVGGIPPSRLATCTSAHPPNRAVACRSARHSARRSASSPYVKPLHATTTDTNWHLTRKKTFL